MIKFRVDPYDTLAESSPYKFYGIVYVPGCRPVSTRPRETRVEVLTDMNTLGEIFGHDMKESTAIGVFNNTI